MHAVHTWRACAPRACLVHVHVVHAGRSHLARACAPVRAYTMCSGRSHLARVCRGHVCMHIYAHWPFSHLARVCGSCILYTYAYVCCSPLVGPRPDVRTNPLTYVCTPATPGARAPCVCVDPRICMMHMCARRSHLECMCTPCACIHVCGVQDVHTWRCVFYGRVSMHMYACMCVRMRFFGSLP